jgi:hypothetical protein
MNSNRRIGSATWKGDWRGFHHQERLCIAVPCVSLSLDDFPLRIALIVITDWNEAASLPRDLRSGSRRSPFV